MRHITAKKVRKARMVMVETTRGVREGRIQNVAEGVVSFIRLDNGAIEVAPLSKVRGLR